MICSDGSTLHVSEERMKTALQYSPSQGSVTCTLTSHASVFLLYIRNSAIANCLHITNTGSGLYMPLP